MGAESNANTNIIGTRFVLAVKDLQKSVAFYTTKLGFTTVWQDQGWHSLRRDEFIVMLGECPDQKTAFELGDHSYFAYVDVTDVNNLYNEYTSKQVEILSQLEDKPWMQREFAIRTIDGHRITFGERIGNAS